MADASDQAGEDRRPEPGDGSSAAGTEELKRLLRGPLDVRSVALTGLFVLAVFYTLFLARSFLLPLVLALLLNLLLSPVVRGLGRLHVPQALGAGLVVLLLLGSLLGIGYLLVEPAEEWMEKAPASLARMEAKLTRLKEPVERMSRATEGMERLADVDGEEPRSAPVQVERGSLSGALFQRTWEIAAGTAVVLVLLYFLLASGDLFLRKLMHTLPTLDDKKRAVDVSRQLQQDLSRYLVAITLINVVLGVAVGAVMHLLEMPNPMLWGVLATILNFVPYLGAMVGVVVLAGVATLTFDEPVGMLLPPLAYFLLTAAEGYFVTPLVLGRRLTLNPVTILLSLLLWGWLWGIAGAVLAVPMLASVKILCDHVQPLRPLGEFLGR